MDQRQKRSLGGLIQNRAVRQKGQTAEKRTLARVGQQRRNLGPMSREDMRLRLCHTVQGQKRLARFLGSCTKPLNGQVLDRVEVPLSPVTCIHRLVAPVRQPSCTFHQKILA